MNKNRDNLGRFLKGHEVKEDWKEKIKIANIGHKPWNLGETKETNTKVKQSAIKNSQIKKELANEGKLKGIFEEKGKDLNRDKQRENTQYKKGCKRPEISGDNNPMKRKEVLKKNLGKRGMSKLEIKFSNLLKELGYNFVFVGDGKDFVGDKCPDFINKPLKIALEVFYRRHKEYFKGSCDKWMIERNKYFNSYGWKIIFFNETECTINKIKEKLKNEM
jgi:hypothetical protein